MPVVTLYATSCPATLKLKTDINRIKQLLVVKQINHEEVDLSYEPQRREQMLADSGGLRLIPQLHVDGKYIGTADEIQELEDWGELSAILAGSAAPAQQPEPAAAALSAAPQPEEPNAPGHPPVEVASEAPAASLEKQLNLGSQPSTAGTAAPPAGAPGPKQPEQPHPAAPGVPGGSEAPTQQHTEVAPQQHAALASEASGSAPEAPPPPPAARPAPEPAAARAEARSTFSAPGTPTAAGEDPALSLSTSDPEEHSVEVQLPAARPAKDQLPKAKPAKQPVAPPEGPADAPPAALHESPVR